MFHDMRQLPLGSTQPRALVYNVFSTLKGLLFTHVCNVGNKKDFTVTDTSIIFTTETRKPLLNEKSVKNGINGSSIILPSRLPKNYLSRRSFE